MHCYAYGGPRDPCALHNNNDDGNGLSKDPSQCTHGDTFYLWDEPDTQGYSYEWAGTSWLAYASRFADELSTLRRRGVRITTPLLKGDSPATYLSAFWQSCGPACSDPSSPAYIDVVAVNAFCGSWNLPSGTTEGCRGGAAFVVSSLPSTLRGGRPVYVTNWSYLGSSTAAEQLAALDAIDALFAPLSPVERVYWFGARDYGGGTSNNLLTDAVTSGERAGTTLGELWAAKCAALP